MLELLRKRRSVRQFTDQPLSDETRALLEETVLRSPSSRRSNQWEFVFVDDRALLQTLSQAKEHGSGLLAGAALGIVICANEERPDVWVEDCSIAATLAQLAAESVPGLGSCWVQIRKRAHNDATSSEEFVKKTLNLPAAWEVECIIAIGYEAARPAPIPASELQRDRIHSNRLPE